MDSSRNAQKSPNGLYLAGPKDKPCFNLAGSVFADRLHNG